MAEPKPAAPSDGPAARPLRIVLLAAFVALLLTAIDLGSKTWAEGALSTPRRGEGPAICMADDDGFIRTQRVRGLPLVFVDDVFELEYAENCGGAFGLLRGASASVRIPIFGLAAILACGALFWMLAKGRGGPYFAAAVPLVASGALGNLIDRIRYGYVVDFIHVHYQDAFDYPTFNVADITITIGVICWIIDALRTGERSGQAAEARSASPRTEPSS